MGVKYSYIPKKCLCGAEIHPSLYTRKGRIDKHGNQAIVRMTKKQLLKKKFCSKECRIKYGEFSLKKGSKLNFGRVMSKETKSKISNTNHEAWVTGKRESQKKENHWNWKGGITSKNRLERVNFKRIMQAKIFERDNYTCQICQQQGGHLQVDHIKKWSNYPELRFKEKNCRTLCMACHYYITFKRKIPNGIIWGHSLSKGCQNAIA